MVKWSSSNLIGLRSQPHSSIAVGLLCADWSIAAESRASLLYLHNSAARIWETVGTFAYDWSIYNELKQKGGHNQEIMLFEIKPQTQTGCHISQCYYRFFKEYSIFTAFEFNLDDYP